MADETIFPTQFDAERIVAAIERTMSVIEFSADGSILRANELFLARFGYSLAEIQGKHHRLLMTPGEAASPQYQQFWASLASGVPQSGQFARVAKDGNTVWLEASYIPQPDEYGRTATVIKFAHDVTEARQAAIATAARLTAIERSTAVMEFEPDGTIVRANAVFLATVGYTEGELRGQHHRMLLTREESQSPAYAAMWRGLAAGETKSGRFQRVAKGGKLIWLEATYNPVLDLDGRVVRVVKFATDITDKVESTRLIEVALEKARESERIREELDRTLQEMSTPVMPIWDAILLLPLVGVVDSARTDDVMRKSLERISETRSKVFILDISGVPAVDTAVANQLLKITKATQLLGCETIISGLSPAIARTMVDLGVDVGEVRTTATLRDAFAIALRKVGGAAAGSSAV